MVTVLDPSVAVDKRFVTCGEKVSTNMLCELSLINPLELARIDRFC